MTYIVRNLETPHGITYGEMVMTASNLLMAGAETTATLLSGLTYYLLKNPTKLEKLVAEIRSTFQSDADITMTSVRQLKYELSAIEEALRLFPPVPTMLPRVTPENGCMIAGQFVPEGTTVSMNLFAAFHSKTNFRDPDQFVPERWSGDPMYKSDNLDIVKPFSLGPRNCIGKHLAYAEIKVILAKLLWNFDLHLCEESERWIDRLRVFGFWEKVPLMVRFDPVVINS
jgi:cytochrome P450